MEQITIVILFLTAASVILTTQGQQTLSTILTPSSELNRQSRSYYDYRYGRPYDRLEDRRCGRCYDDDDDDDDDYDDRRTRSRSKSKGRHEDRVDERDDRKSQKNGTEDDSSEEKHTRRRKRPRYDDRDRYRLHYYDRFLSDRVRDYQRPYNDDYYRRPIYDRYPDYGYPGSYDYGNPAYRQPYYDRYDDAYGGYGPSDGRGLHGSFRPWDETYRGQAGWDAGGRGYYFASGRPDTAPAPAWGRPDYNRYSQPQNEGWQSGGYASGYRDPLDYRSSFGYGQNSGYGQNNGYRQDYYGQSSGWQSAGERRPYRDESGVNKLDNKESYSTRTQSYAQTNSIQPSKNGQNNVYGQTLNYGRSYGQNYVLSTTQETDYLFQREDNHDNVKNESLNETSKDTQ